MSMTGVPSVMAMITAIPASAASMIASAAPAAGTKIIVAFAPVALTASRQVSKTGTPTAVSPPRPGVTPPTRLVPYSLHCVE